MTEATEHTARWVQSLVGELRSYKLLSRKKKSDRENTKIPQQLLGMSRRTPELITVRRDETRKGAGCTGDFRSLMSLSISEYSLKDKTLWRRIENRSKKGVCTMLKARTLLSSP